ncbi:phage holin family protein [uncultured Cellulomonas sp.]|uniref:phage holin family protein n=1 Tax=uncultured Cellulomonas sp. TaxID=189682 RepID=UPI0026079A1F|nr:phage holin family protein [uncultured Cellulomonas sp.]
MGTPSASSGSGHSSGGGEPSIGELFGEVSKDLSTLMRQEVALAKAEATQSAKAAGKGAGMFAGAGYAGHLTVLFLSFALWWALGYWFDNLAWAALVVAALWGIVAAILALRGKKEMKEVGGMPKTADTVKKIPDAVKGNEEAAR